MAKQYTALVIPVQGPLYELTIDEDRSLETLQAAVGGYIQAVPLPGFIPGATRATAYVNEEGKGVLGSLQVIGIAKLAG